MPMPPFLKKKLVDAGASGASGASTDESESESESESGSESESMPPAKGGAKPNPLKQWAKSKM